MLTPFANMTERPVEQEVSHIAEANTAAARESSPITSGQPSRPQPSWWNDDCKMAHLEKTRLFSVFRRYTTQENMIVYIRAQARFRRIVKDSKEANTEITSPQ